MERDNTNTPHDIKAIVQQLYNEPPHGLLRKHQDIVRKFMTQVDIESRGLLVYHTMGTGKTLLAASIAVDMVDRKPIILSSRSLRDNFVEKGLNMYLKYLDVDPMYVSENVKFVSMNASNMLDQVYHAMVPTLKPKNTVPISLIAKLMSEHLFIFDEAHNFFRSISNGSEASIALYNLIRQSACKVLFLTGTPMANAPFELAHCFNMLSKELILPEDWQSFQEFFVSDDNKLKNKWVFQNRLYGLVSYVSHESKTLKGAVTFPKETYMIVKVGMTDMQALHYSIARDDEDKEIHQERRTVTRKKLSKPSSGMSSTYRQISRQLSNAYVTEKGEIQSLKFDKMYDNIQKSPGKGFVYSQFVGNGGHGAFASYLNSKGWAQYEYVKTGGLQTLIRGTRIAEDYDDLREATVRSKIPHAENYHVVLSEKGVCLFRMEKHVQIAYCNCPRAFLAVKGIAQLNGLQLRYSLGVQHTAPGIKNKDIRHIHIVEPSGVRRDVSSRVLNGMRVVDFPKSMKDVDVYETLSHMMLDDQRPIALRRKLPGVIWRQGFSIYTGLHMWAIRQDSIVGGKPPRNVYAVLTGAVKPEIRSEIQAVYNSFDNRNGDIIRLILISSIGVEGLDLTDVRHQHIMEPYWTNTRISQIRARGVRNNAHVNLPEKDRNVHTYLYLAIQKHTTSTDVHIYQKAMNAQKIINEFEDALKEVSIECTLNRDDCRLCTPTNSRLYYSDAGLSVQNPDPCTVKKSKVTAEKLMYNNEEYFYRADPSTPTGYRFYKFDKELDAHLEISQSDRTARALQLLL